MENGAKYAGGSQLSCFVFNFNETLYWRIALIFRVCDLKTGQKYPMTLRYGTLKVRAERWVKLTVLDCFKGKNTL